MTENEAISENDVVIQTHYQNNWDGNLRVVCPKALLCTAFRVYIAITERIDAGALTVKRSVGLQLPC